MIMIIRPATYSDLNLLMKVFEGAKEIMRASGNLLQWNGGYPSKDIIIKDIESGHCFVVCDDDDIIGTMALIPGPDSTYSYIEGRWPDENPYYVIHRIATSLPGRNLAARMFEWAFAYIAEKGYDTIRIDTHRENVIMKHVLTKYGFTECGVIYLESGDPRDAYSLTKRLNS